MNRTKKTVAAILFGCLATSASAVEAQDTLVIEEANKVKIETRDTVQRIVISGMKNDPEFHYVQRISIPDSSAVRRSIISARDFNKTNILKKKNENSKWDTSGRLSLGLNTMVDAPDGYDFKLWPALEIGIGMNHNWHPFGKQNEWSVGWGINWHHYCLDDDKYFTKDAQNMMTLTPYPAGPEDRRTSLNTFSLQLPLGYTHYFDKKHKWSLGLGVIVNWNVYGKANRNYTLNDEDYDIGTRHIGQMPFTFDGVIYVDVPYLPKLYCKYSPSKFFRESRGPEMHQLSFGICLE